MAESQNAMTRGNLRIALARTLEGTRFYTTTATGGTTSTVIDTKTINQVYEDNYFNNWELTNQTQGFSTSVIDFTKNSGTWQVPTRSSAAGVSLDTFELHNPAGWRAADYNNAISMACQAANGRMLIDGVDKTIAYQKYRSLYTLPTGWKALGRVSADIRLNYFARHASGQWDTLTGIKDVSGRTKLAMSFQVQSSNPPLLVGDVYLLLAAVGSPTGTLTLTIETDSSSAPSGTAVWTATYTASSVPIEPTYIRFSSTSSVPVLTKDTTYWLCITASYSASTTNYVAWANDSTDSGYMYGSPMAYSGSAWSALTGDMIFTVRGTQPYMCKLLPQVHYRIVRDTSSPQLELTAQGQAAIGYDGSVLVLEGQKSPTLPTADTDTVDAPFDYITARAALILIAQNEQYFGSMQNAAQLSAQWQKIVGDVEGNIRVQWRPGTMLINPM